MKTRFTIRPVENSASDLEQLDRFCHQLAGYDGHKSYSTPEKLKTGLFEAKATHAVFGLEDGEPVGFLLGYESFSVYQGSHGFYITGVFVSEPCRSRGYGRKLMQYIAGYAQANGLQFLNWMMESANSEAAAFYSTLGAEKHDGWAYCRIAGDSLERLAAGNSVTPPLS